MKTKTFIWIIIFVLAILFSINCAMAASVNLSDTGDKAFDSAAGTLNAALNTHGWSVGSAVTAYGNTVFRGSLGLNFSADTYVPYTPKYPQRFEFQFYDWGIADSARGFLSMTDNGGSDQIGIGTDEANFPGKYEVTHCGGAAIDSGIARANGWHNFTIIRTNEDSNQFYIDGTLVKNSADNCPAFTRIKFRVLTGTKFTIDDMYVCNDVDDCYGLESSSVYTPANISIEITSPLNNTQYNIPQINFTINFTSANLAKPVNFTLYENGNPISNYYNLITNGTINITLNYSTSNQYNYYIFALNNETNKTTENITIYYDQTAPSATTNFTSNNAFLVNSAVSGRFNLTDDLQLFRWDLYIDEIYEGGQEIYTLTSPDGKRFNLSVGFNVTDLTMQPPLASGVVHNFRVNISDGHTSESIGTFDYSKNALTKSLTYNFGKDWIKIYPESPSLLDNFDTQKKIDRYIFIHDRTNLNKDENYIVESSKNLTYINNSKISGGWFVSEELNKWVDFNNDNTKNITVFKIDNKKFRVILKNTDKKTIIINSIGSLNSVSFNYTFFVGNYTEYYSNPQIELTNTEYKISFDYNSSYFKNITAWLFWNNTNISSSSYSVGTNKLNYSKTVMLPNVNTDTNIPFFWNFQMIGANGSIQIWNSTIYNQSILNINLSSGGNCKFNSSNAVLTFVPRDEETDLEVNATRVFTTVELKILGETNKINISFGFVNDLNYTICLSPINETYLADAIVDYDKLDTYSQRNFYLNSYTLGANTSHIINLYLINNSKDTDTTIEVTDYQNDPEEGVFVKTMRYDASTNTYKLVEISKTNNEGKSIARLRWNDVLYQFIIDDGNTTIFTSNQQKVFGNLFFQLSAGDNFLTKYEKLGSISNNLRWDNATSSFIFTYNDANNVIDSACLDVTRVSAVPISICHTCLAAMTGSISCYVNSTTMGDGEYLASTYYHTPTANSNTPGLTLTEKFENVFYNFFSGDGNNSSRLGLFVTIFLLSIMLGVMIWSPSTALLGIAVILFFSYILKFLSISLTSIIGIICIIIYFVMMMRN